MFQRIFDEGLAHASYVLGDDRTRDAVVIDPRRDADVYISLARHAGFRLTHAIETHIHADFVSGARELAAAGTTCVAGPGSDLGYAHRAVEPGASLQVGDLKLSFLHTPGHTPEHIAILAEAPGEPTRLFSGDTLFVGAVGRPDLLGAEAARGLAGDLHQSLFHVLLDLDDGIQVHPAHGAGSLCGAGIGRDPASTIGRERRSNPMLRQPSREAFVAAVLADLPETPPYFPRMKQVNKRGPRVLGLTGHVPPPPALDPVEAARYLESGAVLLDLRTAAAFGAGHPAGAINLGHGSRVGYWAGWVVPADVPTVLLAEDEAQALEAARQLLRVGMDEIAGVVRGGEAWRHAALPVATLPQITAQDLRARRAGGERITVVDVRTTKEWEAGHIDGAVHLPVGQMGAHAADLASEASIAVVCESGHRSSLAASLLARAGLRHIVNVADGMAGWRNTLTTGS
jgi:hydroxyacylglutathione hydrolase